jgi:hypothetical protein
VNIAILFSLSFSACNLFVVSLVICFLHFLRSKVSTFVHGLIVPHPLPESYVFHFSNLDLNPNPGYYPKIDPWYAEIILRGLGNYGESLQLIHS